MAGKSTRGRRAIAPETKPAKRNRLTSLGVSVVDYKDTATLRTFISERERSGPAGSPD